MDRGTDPRRDPHPARLPRVAHRAGRARPRRSRSSSTAPPATAPPSPRRRSRSSATRTSSRSPAATPTGSAAASRPSCRARSTRRSAQRYSRHLLIPEVGEEGQLKLLDSRILLHRRRRPRLAARALPRGRGRRHARHRRRRPRRRLEPPAPDRALDRDARRLEGRVGEADDRGAQPRRRGGHVQRAAHLRERRADPRRRLGRDRRRRRQLPDALPRQRRRRLARHPARARLDLPLRGPGHRLQAARGPVLPLPLPAAAAAGARAELRRGRRARRPAGHRRLAPGERGAEALPRHRRVARRAGCSSSTRSRPSSARSRSAATRTARSAASTRPSPSTSTTSSSAQGRPAHA